ncbi:MAG TPA: AsmA-like C-terminal region-containing protein [Bacteroidales bacterium]|nr:AsmA-like C-terminal region-containing protein [Bacteroidales bacterium]
MRYFPKIIRIALIFVFSVVIILFSAALLMQDKVTGIIIGALNRNILTKIEAGSARLSFFRSFPKASVILKDVLIHSSPGSNPSDFKGANIDTLLFASSVSLVFRPADILRDKYNIETINIRSGECTLLSDRSGKVNYTISSGSGTDNPVTIDLQKVNLSDVRAAYLNAANNVNIWGTITSGNLKSLISGNIIDFTAKSDILIDSFNVFNITINSHLIAGLDLKLNSSNGDVTFAKSTLSIDKYEFVVDGTISGENVCNLIISGKNIDLSDLRHYLPEKYSAVVKKYDPEGKISAECSIKGMVSRTKNPIIELNCSVDNGSIVYRPSGESIQHIAFKGHFTNGSQARAETSSVSVTNLKFSLGPSDLSGSLLIRNFARPLTEITLAGKVYPERVIDFFNLRGFPVSGGYADVDLNFRTDHPLSDQFTKNNFIDHIPRGNLVFSDFSLGGEDQKTVFRHANGLLAISDDYAAENLAFNYEGHKIAVTGKFLRIAEWLAGRKVTLMADADVSIDKYFVGNMEAKGNEAESQSGITFPRDMILNIRLKADSVRYKSFSAADFNGNFNYKPKVLNFKSLKMKTLDGMISGDGFIAENANKSVISRGTFNVSDINVNKAFLTFNNFGQQFIVADNLSGSLSGSISLLMPMDQMFTPKVKEVTAEGRYTLLNGTLKDFEPVKQLSSFIELSELENIYFDKLENDFFIRNNVLFIPQMDVRSSAADLTVNGQHSFENNYEYHVRMLLSELLSKKRKTIKKPVTEFGAVQDDGLGRTSILLKVVNKGDDVKVSYDMKAASAGVKKNMQNEKKNLKTILNEEYGWYGNEAGKATQQPAAGKKRFNVSWDETDTVTAAPVKEEKEEGGFRSLFRKK